MGKPNKTAAQRALAACRGAFLAVACFSLIVNLLMLTVPLYMLQVFDRVLSSRSEETLIMLTIVAAGAFVLLAALDIVRSRVLLRASTRLELDLGGEALMASISSAVHGGGHSAQALRDVNQLRGFLTGSGVLALFDAPWTPVFIAVIYLFHPLLGFIALVGALLLFVLAIVNDFATRKSLTSANAASLTALNTAQASIRNADVVEAMGMAPGVLKHWFADNVRALELQLRASRRSGNITSVAKALRLMVQILMLGTGAYLVIYQELTPGVMIAGVLLMARALAPVEKAISVWRSLIATRVAYGRLNEILAAWPRRDSAMELPRPDGSLAVERLIYYPPDGNKAILKGVSFELKPGQVLGVVGPTAAGKSTLAKLLVGSWQPTAGKVRLDGADVYSWNRQSFGQHVGYLPQDVELFSGTVRDNIARLGEVDPEAVIAAARLAGVHDMVLRLPSGYETEIGDGGEFLSGGQRQRIALARAMLGQPCLLVLDEPNANLDTAGEKDLLAALSEAKAAGMTIVVITHRRSILEVVDKMLVLNNGTMEAFGPRADVVKQLTQRASAAEPDKPAALPKLSLKRATEKSL